MTDLRTLATIAATAFSIGVVGTVPAIAQSQNDMQLQQGQSVDVDDDALRSYASAAVEIRQIDQAYSGEMQAAETQEEMQSVRREAQGEMIEAIEEEGLSVEKYNQIGQAARQDPEVMSTIRTYMQEAE